MNRGGIVDVLRLDFHLPSVKTPGLMTEELRSSTAHCSSSGNRTCCVLKRAFGFFGKNNSIFQRKDITQP